MTEITVPAVPTFIEYSPSGATVGPFVVPFPFFGQDDVKVRITDLAGVVTNYVVTTDFTFTQLDVPAGQEGSGYTGGAITMLVSFGSDAGSVIKIYRDTIIDRTANFPSTGPFSIPVLNDEQNNEIMILQEFSQEIIDGLADAITSPDGGNMILPSAASRADNYLKFDGSGDVAVAVGTGSGSGGEWATTSDELAAGITIFDSQYPPGQIDRYVNNVVPGTTDVGVELQAFWDFVTGYPVGIANCSGDFATSVGITVGHATEESESLVFSGNFKITAIAAIDTIIQLQNTSNVFWSGRVHVIGTGGTSYSSRTCRIGIKVANSPEASSRMSFDNIQVQRVWEFGVYCSTLSTLTDLGNMRLSDCGSGHHTTDSFSLLANWSNRVDSGTTNSVGQLSTIDVDQMPPPTIESENFVWIDGNAHQIMATDVGASTITVYPWIKPNVDTSGTLKYLHGGGVYTSGGDSGIIGMNMVDATRCGIACFEAALYGAQIARVVTQFCGVGFCFGREGNAAQLGGSINGLYCEANTFDILRNCRDITGRTITNEYALNLDKVAYSCYAGSTGDVTNVNLAGIVIFYHGRMLQLEGIPGNRRNTDATPTWSIFDTAQAHAVQQRDSTTITLIKIGNDENINQHFGNDSGSFTVIGTNSDGSPSGTVTFLPLSGWTVNGVSSVAWSGFDGPAYFVGHIDYANSDVFIYPMTLSIDPVTPVTTTAELEDNSDAINTSALKVAGYPVFNTTTGLPLWASGNADADVWVDATGSTAHTPV